MTTTEMTPAVKPSTATTALAPRQQAQEAPVLIKFKVNEEVILPLMGFLTVNNRSEEQERRLNAKRKRECKLMEIDWDAYERLNNAGKKVADTGTEMFFAGQKGNPFSFSPIPCALEKSGYALADVYSYQKPGDSKHFLCFEFKTGQQERTAGFENFTQTFADLTDASYQYVHIWDNPDGTMTINAAGPIAKKMPELSLLRVYEKGSLDVNKEELPTGMYFFR